MKSYVVCLVILGAVLSLLTSTQGQDFCDSKSTLSMTERDDVLVTSSSSSSNDVQEFDWSLEALNGYRPEAEPLDGDHDLIVGDCEANFDFTYRIDMCIYPDPENGTGTENITVQFSESLVIDCIKVLDEYNNTAGEDFGGYPFLDGGGIGSDHVDLRFVSQEAHGMKFHMEISAELAGTTTVDTTPGETTPGETTPGETTPEETTPEETTPEETTPGETTTTVGSTEGTTSEQVMTTTTPSAGHALGPGKFRVNWFLLSCFVLFVERIFGK